MATYYIDLIEGKSENDGLSEKSPAKNVMDLNILQDKEAARYSGKVTVVKNKEF